jgi:general secretion pathway protein C
MKFDMHTFFTAKYAKWIIISLISVFSLLIIGEYSTLFISSLPNPVADPHLPVITKVDSTNHILNTALFGVYVANDLNDNNVKKSMLNVTLVGILFGNKGGESQVIIRTANGEEQTYSINDKIPGGALIKRITAGGVLVQRNGALESLSLPKNDLIFEPLAQPLKEE